jgi:hypothetical protein
VRQSNNFYPNDSPHADTSACFKSLQNSDFGFAYQVLSFERKHKSTQSFKSAQMNRYSSAGLNDLLEYGPYYLSGNELKQQVQNLLDDYHRFLAVNWLIGFRDREFWTYHKTRLRELGFPLHRSTLVKAAMIKVLTELLNPEQAIRKFRARITPVTEHIPGSIAQSESAGLNKENGTVRASDSVHALAPQGRSNEISQEHAKVQLSS